MAHIFSIGVRSQPLGGQFQDVPLATAELSDQYELEFDPGLN